MKTDARQFDMHKYDRKPIPVFVDEIKKEIRELKAESKDTFLSPIEQQLILDRIEACSDRIKEIQQQKLKVTPILNTQTIAQTRAKGKNPSYMISESKMLI